MTLTWDDPENSSITGHQVLRRTRDGDQYGDGQGASEFVVIINDTGSAAPTYNDTSVRPPNQVRIPSQGQKRSRPRTEVNLPQR